MLAYRISFPKYTHSSNVQITPKHINTFTSTHKLPQTLPLLPHSYASASIISPAERLVLQCLPYCILCILLPVRIPIVGARSVSPAHEFVVPTKSGRSDPMLKGQVSSIHHPERTGLAVDGVESFVGRAAEGAVEEPGVAHFDDRKWEGGAVLRVRAC
jgi:hypothetical protein